MLVSSQLHGFNRARPRMRYFGGPERDYYASSWGIPENSGLKTGLTYGGSGYQFYVGPPSQDKCVIITNCAYFGINNPILPDDFGGVGRFHLAISPTISSIFTDGTNPSVFLSVSREDTVISGTPYMRVWSAGTLLVRIPSAEYISIGSTYYKTVQVTEGSGTSSGSIAVDTRDFPVYTDFEGMQFFTFNYEGNLYDFVQGFVTTGNTGGSSRERIPGSLVISASFCIEPTAAATASWTPIIDDIPNNQWNFFRVNQNNNSFFYDTDSGGLHYALSTAVFSPNSYTNEVFSPIWTNSPSRVLTQTTVRL